MKWHSDPGHAWLEVSRAELKESGVADQISRFSYIGPDGFNFYLEEDCDAPLFLNAMLAKGVRLTPEKSPRDGGWIRKLRHYK